MEDILYKYIEDDNYSVETMEDWLKWLNSLVLRDDLDALYYSGLLSVLTLVIGYTDSNNLDSHKDMLMRNFERMRARYSEDAPIGRMSVKFEKYKHMNDGSLELWLKNNKK